ncbi:MAG: CDP-alcohol phosphatidyltransferase family protein [Vicinamibacterales bacterium]
MTHVRVNHGLTAALERRLLIWLARRLPGWVHSDHLTAVAVVGTAMASASFALARLFPVALVGVGLGLAVNWFGDSLDGTLARVRRQERPRYGYYVDHVLDICGVSALMGGLALSGYMSPLLALGVLVAYLLVSAEVFLATAVGGEFRLSFARVGPTELRLALSAAALALLRWPEADVPGLGRVLVMDLGGAVAAVGLLLALAVSALSMGWRLYQAESRPAVARF